MFIDRLVESIKEKNNPTVMGLDPKLEYIPNSIKDKYFKECGQTFEAAGLSIIEFNKRLMDATYDVVPSVKPQLAYYEMYGIEGMKAFKETVDYAKSKGLIVIADGKRNDIGTTATAYAQTFLGRTKITDEIEIAAYDVDALTVNPYFGIDGVDPFIDCCDKYHKGIFILAKTSNRSSMQLQDIMTDDEKLIYEVVARLIHHWGACLKGKCGYSSVGAVVGATFPQQLKILRKLMPKAFILVPGYGAQGGTAKDVAKAFDRKGLGAIINSSRGLICAWKSQHWNDKYTIEEFDEACRQEAIRMRDELVSFL